MARLAIFIDGGYLDKIAEGEFRSRVDFRKLVDEIRGRVAAKTPEPLDLLRTLYYHCLPYQSDPPTPEESSRFSRARQFFEFLRGLERFQVREGRLAFLGIDTHGQPIFQQKRTDLLLGLDFATLSGTRQITHAAVLAGDSDLLPAFDLAKQQGVSVWLFHGPRVSRLNGKSTFAHELRLAADERVEIDASFMGKVRRST